jgi:hypothetical protein
LGPLYCTYLYTQFPRRHAERADRVFSPSAQVSFSESAFEISAKEQGGQVPWTSIKEVWECPSAFLLVFSQFALSFIVVPKDNLPTEARDLLARKVKGHAA